MSAGQMDDEGFYKDNRIDNIKKHRLLLRKSLANAARKNYDAAMEMFEVAADIAENVVRDDNQFYLKQLFSLYSKYYAAYKRVHYEEGAKKSLLWITAYLKRIKMPKQKKTQILVDILKKYEASGGAVDDIKVKWQNPLADEPEPETAAEADTEK